MLKIEQSTATVRLSGRNLKPTAAVDQRRSRVALDSAERCARISTSNFQTTSIDVLSGQTHDLIIGTSITCSPSTSLHESCVDDDDFLQTCNKHWQEPVFFRDNNGDNDAPSRKTTKGKLKWRNRLSKKGLQTNTEHFCPVLRLRCLLVFFITTLCLFGTRTTSNVFATTNVTLQNETDLSSDFNDGHIIHFRRWIFINRHDTGNDISEYSNAKNATMHFVEIKHGKKCDFLD